MIQTRFAIVPVQILFLSQIQTKIVSIKIALAQLLSLIQIRFAILPVQILFLSLIEAPKFAILPVQNLLLSLI